MPITRFGRALMAATVLTASTAAWGQDAMSITYPETRKGDVVETQFGEAIADPYRWLENDVRSDAEVAKWVESQSALTQNYLKTLPQRAWFMQRIRALMDYERFGLPVKGGKRYFYTRNTGLQNQSPLYVREGLNGAARVLIDPNTWAKDGATALDSWNPSDDGSRLLYSVQDGGTDWRILRVMDVNTGQPLADEIRWAKFTGLAWVGNDGFLYSRFPEPEAGQAFQAKNFNSTIYYHKIGTPQSADVKVYATPDHPAYGHGAGVTADGRYAIITTSEGTDSSNMLRVIHLKARARDGWKVRTLIDKIANNWSVIDTVGTTLYAVTNLDAPRSRVMKIDLAKPGAPWVEVIPQGAENLVSANIVGNQLIVSYLKDASSVARIYGLDGKPGKQIALTGIGTASGFNGKPGDSETFYTFSSFNRPSTIYRMDLKAGKSTVFSEPKLTFDPDKYAVEQRFYTSKDGTRVPMFVIRNKALADAKLAAPTLLYGYGGFDISITPSYSAAWMAWMEAGGVLALANLRGGGEYGKAWHDAGRRANKQNVFDDFITAGEYLIAQGITPKTGLTIQGRSNGGLLIGAVMNQRPDLFAAGNAGVGVMDMLRFDRFTAGRYWVDDYGYPSKEADFRILRAYSPYHNIRTGVEYPALLVTTADTDDRVVPGHSFKYIAAMQAAQTGAKPHLIRIETRAGHGSGKPTDKVVEEGADVLAFLAQWSGLKTP